MLYEWGRMPHTIRIVLMHSLLRAVDSLGSMAVGAMQPCRQDDGHFRVRHVRGLLERGAALQLIILTSTFCASHRANELGVEVKQVVLMK